MKNKNCRRSRTYSVTAAAYPFFSDRSLYLAGTHATCAHVNCFMSSADNSLYLLHVRLPHSAGLSVRVRNIMSESDTLLTEFALCHFSTSSRNQTVGFYANLSSYHYHYYYITSVRKLQYLFQKNYFFFFADFLLFSSFLFISSSVSTFSSSVDAPSSASSPSSCFFTVFLKWNLFSVLFMILTMFPRCI